MIRDSRPVLLMMGFSVVALLGSGVSAKEESSGAAAGQASRVATQASEVPIRPAQPSATKAGPQDEVRTLLDGTSWALDLMPLSGAEKAKPQQDTVSFAKTTVVSEQLSKVGYPASNYSLTIGDDGVTVWETMQTKEGDGVAFWRGELHGVTMRGMLSRHPVEGPAKDFSFVGKKSEVAPAQPAEPPPQAVTQPTVVAPDAAERTEPAAPKKKKRGWF